MQDSLAGYPGWRTPTDTDLPHSSRMPTRLLFLAPGDVSKGRVEPISWMRTCEAYAVSGLDVTLLSLGLNRPDAIPGERVWRHFGVDECFRIVTVPTPLRHDSSVTAFRLSAGCISAAFAAASLPKAFGSRAIPGIVHARSPVMLAPYAALRRLLARRYRPRLVFETHALPKESNGWIVRAADLVVVNSDRLAAETVAAFGTERVIHAPLPPYNDVRPQPRETARMALGLDSACALACYTGKLTEEHSEFLLRACAVVVGRIARFRMLIVGGNPRIFEWTRKRVDELGLSDVVLLSGFVDPERIGIYQSAADVLVNYIPPTIGIFRYMTPAKAYEYQAMGKPIVTTDFPLFDEVYGGDGVRAIRVAECTPEAFAAGIEAALALPNGGREMAERAMKFARERTWRRRSTMILQALGA